MLKLVRVLFSVILILSLCMVVFASEASLDQTPDLYDPQRTEEIANLMAAVERAGYYDWQPSNTYGIRTVYPIIEQNNLNVPLYQQTTYYYCAPACVHMVLSFFDDDLENIPDQDTLASIMCTDPVSGTIVYQIRDCLNRYLGAGAYRYVLESELSFSRGMQYSIDAGHPVICNVQTEELDIYNGHVSGHYVVITGYYSAYGTPNGIGDCFTVTYNDPNWNSAYYGTFECDVTEMEDAINAGNNYYIMGAGL